MEFTTETMNFLEDLPGLEKGYIDLSLEQITGVGEALEAEGMTQAEMPEVFNAIDFFTTTVVSLGTEDLSSVLTIKVDEDLMLERVYGPAIFSEEGELVVKVGSNLIPLERKGNEAQAGTWTGDIEVVEREIEEAGVKRKYIVAHWEILALEDEAISIPLMLDADKMPSKAAFKKALKDGEILEYIKPVPKGGNYIDMREMEIGEYRVIELIEEEPHPEYGRSWTMTVDGLGKVRSRGKRFEGKLASKAPLWIKQLKAGKPLTLFIASKTEMSQGVQINASCFCREADPSKLIVGGTQKALEPALETIDVKAA